jgi:hypothetical protein
VRRGDRGRGGRRTADRLGVELSARERRSCSPGA